MQLSTVLSASLVAVASATYPPINLGTYTTKWELSFIAWSPFTPTTTEEVTKVCDSHGALNGTATWTSVAAYDYYYNTNPVKPVCRNPFNITDDATGTTYYNLELACEDDSVSLTAGPVVTAVVDGNTNKEIQKCVQVPKSGAQYGACTEAYGGAVSYQFACTADGI